MIIRPSLKDIKIILSNLGKISIILGIVMVFPLLIAILFKETDPMYDYLIGIFASFITGLFLIQLSSLKDKTDSKIKWMHGMTVVSLSWIMAMVLGAIPLYLSGHFRSFLDACFDTMSGFATTGLALITDLDHLSYAHNMWRHLMIFLGGQGIILVGLTLFMSRTRGAFRLYVGEVREENILPNVIETVRVIWSLSIVYLILGSTILTIIMLFEGIPLSKAVLHGIWIFMATFDTGGFAPQSQNILYYHSPLFELATMFIMLLGAMNFRLHYALWTGNRKEIFRDIEIASFFITMGLTFFITSLGLSRADVYPGAIPMFRKGFYQLVSGHTGTGYATIYPRQFINEWTALAIMGLSTAMALGGGVCSTTGGIKALRIGIIYKAFSQEIKHLLTSELAVIIQRFHHIKDNILNDKQIKMAFLVTFNYLILFGIGALFGVFYGYPLMDSIFESISAAANVGLSCGITTPFMPTGLKIVYIIEMWAGRLEFMSIFVLAGLLVSMIRGK